MSAKAVCLQHFSLVFDKGSFQVTSCLRIGGNNSMVHIPILQEMDTLYAANGKILHR